jgi:ornithine carbamoyltransferase
MSSTISGYDPAYMEVPHHLRGRDFLRVEDWSADELVTLLELAAELKRRHGRGEEARLLPSRTLGMIFDKPSTRTRVSFAAGMVQLGGAAVPLATGELQLGRGETVRDTALVLSRYLDAVVVRTYRQSDLEELARHASIPVVNGLTDEFHPCQALADALTLRERFGDLERVRVAYIGDGNNVCHSLMAICARLGVDFVASNPPGYEPRADVVAAAREAADAAGGSIGFVREPGAAATSAHALYTDVWTSMGQDAEAEQRRQAFAGHRIDEALLAIADPRAIVMHDLPAHYGEEIDEDLLHGPRSAAWDQAENRLHAQKALLALIVA